MNIPTDQYDEEAKKNFDTIKYEISVLESNHYKWFLEMKYKDFWAHAKQISEMFKTLKPIKKGDRENLWSKFNSVCDEANRKQTAEYETRNIKSEGHKNEIINEIRRAQPCSLFGFAPPDIQEMKHLGSVLKNAGLMLSKYKTEMLGKHKQECFESIQEMQKEHNAWWESLTGHRSRKREDFQQNVRSNIEKNHERLKKATDALDHCNDHAADLREKIRDAWSDEYRDRAEGWLSEDEDKIKDIEESIQQIENWIREDEEKLR